MTEPPAIPYPACGRRWRAAPDEGRFPRYPSDRAVLITLTASKRVVAAPCETAET
jgi:hypothetical protein